MPVNILVDARTWKPGGAGKSRYVSELLPALMAMAPADRFVLLVSPGFSAPLSGNARAVEVRRAPLLDLPRLATQAAADVFFSPTSYLLPVRLPMPTVVVVHDLAVWREPRARPALKTALLERMALRPALSRAAAVIAVSESTGRDVVALLPRVADKLTVIQSGVPAAVAPRPGAVKALGLESGFILFVGTLEPRKNLESLIEAFAGLPPEMRARAPLVLAGRRGWRMQHLDRLKEQSGAAAHIRELGFVQDEVLAALYEQAGMVVCPSWYEGFDFPALEAMQHGAPVIASNTSSHPEVIGDAGSLVEPGDVASLTRRMAEVLSDPVARARMIAAGRARAREFAWPRAASATLAVLRRVAR